MWFLNPAVKQNDSKLVIENGQISTNHSMVCEEFLEISTYSGERHVGILRFVREKNKFVQKICLMFNISLLLGQKSYNRIVPETHDGFQEPWGNWERRGKKT